MTIEICNICDLAIADTDSDSIQCDICQAWVHAWRDCSKLKKTIYKLIRKKDPFVCSKCTEFGRLILNDSDFSKVKQELLEVRDLNLVLMAENRQFSRKLKELESEIALLRSRNRGSSHTSLSPAGSVTGQSPDQSSLALSIGTQTDPVCNLNDFTNFHNEASQGRPIDNQHDLVLSKPSCDLNSPLACEAPDTIENLNPSSEHLLSIKFIGDSHGRDLRPFLKENLSRPNCRPNLDFVKPSPNVSVDLFPGTPMEYYVDRIVDSMSNSTIVNSSNELKIILGGVNYISRDSIDTVIKTLESNAHLFRANRIAIAETLYRYDDESHNPLIKEQNLKLKELCDKLGWCFIPVNFALYRLHYKKHGLHLNLKGKKLISELLGNFINSHFLG